MALETGLLRIEGSVMDLLFFDSFLDLLVASQAQIFYGPLEELRILAPMGGVAFHAVLQDRLVDHAHGLDLLFLLAVA